MRFKDDFQKLLYYTAQIDYCYWTAREVMEKINDGKTKMSDIKDQLLYMAKKIISCKKKLELDVTKDVEFLNSLKKIKVS